MAEKKSLVEETLLQMKSLENVISENAKGILHSTMKEEIGELVKESLKEAEETHEESEDVQMFEQDDEISMDDDDSMTDTETDTDDMTDDTDDMDMADEMGMEDEDEMDDEPIDLRGLPFDEVADIISKMDDNDKIMVVKDGEDSEMSDEDEDTLEEDFIFEDDMMFDEEETDEWKEISSDEGYSMDEDDSLEETIYEIEMDEESDEEEETESMTMEVDEDDSMMDEEDSMMDEEDDMDETIYEIEMDEEDDSMDMEEEDEDMDETLEEGFKAKGTGFGSAKKFKYASKPNQDLPTKKQKQGPKSVGTGKAKFEYKEGTKMKMKPVKAGGETSEASRTLASGRRFGRKGLPKPKAAPRHLNVESVNNEVKLLREKNEEYRKALNVFRTKLNEVAVFNSNLAYATRLFTEHSTTKQEKINILRRFDGVESLKESKALYKTIKDELSSQTAKASIAESLQEKIERAPQSGSAASLIESKTYENPQFMRMKDLMSKMNIIK